MGRRKGRLHHPIGPPQQLTAWVEELDENLGSFRMYGIDQPPERRDAVIGGSHQQGFRVARGLMHADDLDDDQPGATARPGTLVGDQRLGRQTFLGQVGIVPGGEDASADFSRLDAVR